MTNGWRAIRVDYALAVRHATDVEEPTDVEPPKPIPIRQPGEKLKLKVWFLNDTSGARDAYVRLVGLGEAIVGRSEEKIAERPSRSDARWHPRTFEFQLPTNLRPGRSDVAIEWIDAGSGGGEYEPLAVGELPIVVDDITKVGLELAPKVTSAWLSAPLTITLTNAGSESVTLSLASYAPSNGWTANAGPAPDEGRKERLFVDFTPTHITLAPGQRCTATGVVRRRVRWFGQPRNHVFDVVARSSSGSVTATGGFRQRAVVPSWLVTAAIAAILVVVLLWGLPRLVGSLVTDSSGPPGWRSLPPAELTARTEHTATWVSFARPEPAVDERVVDRLLGRSDRENAVVVWGGSTTGGAALADGAIYDADSNAWTPIRPLPDTEARRGHAAVWTGEQLVVWGGFTPQNLDSADSGWLEETPYYGAAYDPVADTWAPLPPSGLSPRIGHSMLWTGDALIVFGGMSPDGRVLGDGGILRAGRLTTQGTSTAPDLADLTDGVWSLFRDAELGSFRNAPRAFHAAAFDGRYMMISGGIAPRGRRTLVLDDAYTYDLWRNRWAYVGNALFESRACHQTVRSGTALVTLGGLTSADVEGVDTPLVAATGDDAIALSPEFCLRPRTIDRRDPVAWQLTLTPPEEEPDDPVFEWVALENAPSYLGANFVAGATAAGIGVAIPVESLDGVVPVHYVPDERTDPDRLPSTKKLAYRSQLVAAWDRATGRVLVWGGRGPGCEGDSLPVARLPATEPLSCLHANGARIDAGS